jgi:transposase
MINEPEIKETRIEMVTISTAEYDTLKAHNAKLSQQMNWLMEQMRFARHRQFGASSEKSE